MDDLEATEDDLDAVKEELKLLMEQVKAQESTIMEVREQSLAKCSLFHYMWLLHRRPTRVCGEHVHPLLSTSYMVFFFFFFFFFLFFLFS